MEISSYLKNEKMANPYGIDACKLYDSELAEMIHISLPAGESLVKHITPVDTIFYVLEGEATIEIGEEQQNAEKDSLITSIKGIPHKISNRSDRILRFLVIKLPKPTSPPVIIEG